MGGLSIGLSYMGLSNDIAFCAGLFEGEGYVAKHAGHNTWRLGINMTDREPLERICKIFGGNILGPYERKGPQGQVYKPIYNWALSGYLNILKVYNAFKDYLSPRRLEQFQLSLSILPRKLQPCGTYGGFQRHFRRKEIPCIECASARNSYQNTRYHKTREI